MVFLAITSAGLAEALRQAADSHTVWCGSDAISEAGWASLGAPDLSRFTYPLGDRELLEDAITTIKEHHPGQTIWVEAS
ncbi:hypothetical protein DZC73_12955 [Albitalea terrae]|uniref:Uncharacterized protein n=1 Tax=Piscinibacter terrae TaxID=2496871 RepID=A0A3N7HTL5_9BURK|nr:hypothetical protein DZC73_12955 [Albitalea terrae]